MPAAPPKIQEDPSNWWHYSLNQWWGCEKISPACANCYAELFDKYAGRQLDPAKRLHWGKGVPRVFIKGFGEKIRKLNAAYERYPEWHRPRVFANSMNDWLDPAVPVEWLWGLLSAIKDCKAMDHLLLTKRPELFEERLMAVWKAIPEARKSMDWWLAGGRPMNVWAGATVENQHYADIRIPQLLKIGAAVNWLSIEPALSDVNLVSVGVSEDYQFNSLQKQGITWVVLGGESGGKARPSNPLWFESIQEQCKETGTAIWFKQHGEWVGGLYHPDKSKVMLENGQIWWVQTEKQRKQLHFWGHKKGVYEVISARVGMNPKVLPKFGDGPEEFSNNYLLGRSIIRGLPVVERAA